MSVVPNPYATPKAVVADPGASAESEAVRREHLSHEANVKAVGGLYMLGGVFAAFTGLAVILPMVTGRGVTLGMLVTSLIVTALAAAALAVGWGLRMLRIWARIPGIVLAAIGLLAFPIGTLINAYVLWLLASRKGRMVLSAEYATVLEATPHIRYRMSVVIWVALAVIVLLIVIVVVPGLPGR
jgi:hypothetical protein